MKDQIADHNRPLHCFTKLEGRINKLHQRWLQHVPHTKKKIYRFIDMVKHNNQTTASQKRSYHTTQSSKILNDPSTSLKPNKLHYRLFPSADETRRRRRTDQLFPLTAARFFFCFWEVFFKWFIIKVFVQISLWYICFLNLYR